MSIEIEVPHPEPRILIAEGPWSMKENWIHYGSMGEDELGYDVVVHKCNWKNNWLLKTHDVPLFIMQGDDPYCMHCNAKVPNMFKTLWTLKNLDKIQDGAQYGKFDWSGSFYMTPGVMNIIPGQIIQYNPSLNLTGATSGLKGGSNWFYVPTLPKPWLKKP